MADNNSPPKTAYLYLLVNASVKPDPNSQSKIKSTNQQTTSNSVGKLEFRIAPRADRLASDSLPQDIVKRYIKTLEEKGPQAASNSEFAWFSASWFYMKQGMGSIIFDLVMANYKNQPYLLLSNKEPNIMLANRTWGLEKVYTTTGVMGRPAVGFEFDENGSKLFYNLTKSNIGNQLAIIIDAQVMSVPNINSPVSKSGVIEGQFTKKEVDKIVAELQKGMPPTKTKSEISPQASADFTRPVSLSLKNGEYLSLDSGKLLLMPENIQDTNSFHKWTRDNNMDIAASISPSGQTGGLGCIDMAVRQVYENAWLDMSGSEVRNTIDQLKPAADTFMAASPDTSPKTYIFKTRSGKIGMLRFPFGLNNRDEITFFIKYLKVDAQSAPDNNVTLNGVNGQHPESSAQQPVSDPNQNYKTRYFVRVVIDNKKGNMTFQGADVNDNTLNEALAKVPDPRRTVLEIAFAPGTAPEPNSVAWMGIVQGMEALKNKYRFSRITLVGEQPLGSKGGPSEKYLVKKSAQTAPVEIRPNPVKRQFKRGESKNYEFVVTSLRKEQLTITDSVSKNGYMELFRTGLFRTLESDDPDGPDTYGLAVLITAPKKSDSNSFTDTLTITFNTGDTADIKLTGYLDPNNSENWQQKFNEVYRLDQGQILKRIAPPFIPERKEFYEQENPMQANAIPKPPAVITFHWDGSLKIWSMTFISSKNNTLGGVLQRSLSINNDQYEGSKQVLDLLVPGDWIVRWPSSEEDRLKALEKILQKELGKNIHFVKRQTNQQGHPAEKWFVEEPNSIRQGRPLPYDNVDEDSKLQNQSNLQKP